MAGAVLADARSGKYRRPGLAGLFRQSVFGRIAGCEDVNDTERLRYDPAMRWFVGGKAAQRSAASPSQMGRFETQWLAAPENLSALADLSGQWIDAVHGCRPPRGIVLDMDSSVSPTHGEQGLRPPTLETTMQTVTYRPEAPNAVRNDLGAIFISMELSRSTWLITSLSPGGGE